VTTMDRGSLPPARMCNPLLTGALGAYAAALGRAVERAWAARRDHMVAFPEVAARCLRE
jgi:hypothetical protein